MKRNKISVGSWATRGTCSLSALLLAALLAAGTVSASVGPLTLPDNRAWEQVSPVDKEGTDVSKGAAMAAVDGNRILFRAQGPFAGAETSIGVDGISYIATRTANGWTTKAIMPPGGAFTLGFNGYQGFTEDLSKGVISWNDGPLSGMLDPEAPLHENGNFGQNLYLRDFATDDFQLVNGTLNHAEQQFGFAWGSSDFGKLAILSSQALTPDSPCTGVGGTACAYEWDHGALRLASIVDGNPARGLVGSRQGEGGGNFDHAMSDDGSRLFFTSPPNTSGSENGGPPTSLYVREDGTSTTLISASERTLSGGASGAGVRFQSAEAAHGNRVLFATTNSLVDSDTDSTNDLYLYDFTQPEGERLTLISADQNPDAPSGASVVAPDGFVGAAEDLRRAYFVANNQIVPGEPAEPGPKLYLWDDTGASPEVTYIGTLRDGGSHVGGDNEMWLAPSITVRYPVMRTARWSKDGRFLTFLSFAKLTDFDNEGRREVYRYDALADSLLCVSCTSDAFPAEGEIDFNHLLFGARPINHLPRNVTESGQVFFETTRGLVPRDSNGRWDVYEYDSSGQLHLISSGTGAHDSHFLDATRSGSDVFFATRDRLVGWDVDDNYDVYDARVNGGLPEPPIPPPPCEGDSCQPPPLVPGVSSLASASFNGPGDPAARKPRRRCGAGKVRRGGKCRKKKRAIAKQKGGAR